MDDKRNQIDVMFQYEGKASKLIGTQRLNAYESAYRHLTEMQKSGNLPISDNYLGDNELAKNIYEKKYYLKDLDNELIEKSPEDVFKRLASFLATVEGGKINQICMLQMGLYML